MSDDVEKQEATDLADVFDDLQSEIVDGDIFNDYILAQRRREEIIERIVFDGVSYREVSKKTGFKETTLRKWVRDRKAVKTSDLKYLLSTQIRNSLRAPLKPQEFVAVANAIKILDDKETMDLVGLLQGLADSPTNTEMLSEDDI